MVVDANTPDGQGQEMVGGMLVVNPGSLRQGRYAVIDLEPYRCMVVFGLIPL